MVAAVDSSHARSSASSASRAIAATRHRRRVRRYRARHVRAAAAMSAPGFTGAGLDRADHLRLDAERVADMMANGDARLLRLAELDPVLDEEGRLAWDPLDGRGRLSLPRPRRGRALVRAFGADRGARPAGVERVPHAGDDEPEGRRDLGRGAQRQRMAQSPPFLRHVRQRDRVVPRRLGPQMRRVAAPSISRASIRW